jgi:hypothetical protein
MRYMFPLKYLYIIYSLLILLTAKTHHRVSYAKNILRLEVLSTGVSKKYSRIEIFCWLNLNLKNQTMRWIEMVRQQLNQHLYEH